MTTAKPALAEPPRKFSVLPIAVILLLLVGLAGAAVLASHWRDAALARSANVVQPTPASPAPQPAANPAANPPATSSVTVTAVPQIIETTSSAAASKPAISAPTQVANSQPPPRAAAPEPVLQPPQPQLPPAPQATASAADDFYDAAMAKIGQGEAQQARKLLHRALVQDPHYARAHFRMGEIAMMNRNFDYALKEYQQALDDGSRLSDRERALTELGVAVSTHNRPESLRMARSIDERWPEDPDLLRIEPAFPGMFLEGRNTNVRPRRFRPH